MINTIPDKVPNTRVNEIEVNQKSKEADALYESDDAIENTSQENRNVQSRQEGEEDKQVAREDGQDSEGARAMLTQNVGIEVDVVDNY